MKLLWIFLLALCSLSAEVKKQPHSSGNIDIETVPNVGLVKLNGTTVAQPIRLTGSLLASGATLASFDIVGEANLTNTHIENASILIGSLQTVHSTFENSLTIHTQKSIFTASTLQGITVRKDPSLKGKQVLELKQGTIVNGSIHFESGKGEVLLYPGSKIIGQVTGGKVIRKS